MDPQWTRILVSLPGPPDQAAWEVLSAFASVHMDVGGIEDPRPATGGAYEAILYFPPGTDPAAASRQLTELLLQSGLPEARVSIAELVENRDWGHGWREFFKLTRVGARLYVAPPWEATLPNDAPANTLLVQIEPGQAFGTGTHATTRLCLAALEELTRPGDVLLDVGAGSGILSIAAIKLGAVEAIGLEKDPICRENFQENARLNQVADKVHLVEGSTPREALSMALLLGVSPPTRIVCNMLATEFLPILLELARIPAPLLLSGFLESERETIREECHRARFRVAREFSLDEWAAFALEHTAPGGR